MLPHSSRLKSLLRLFPWPVCFSGSKHRKNEVRKSLGTSTSSMLSTLRRSKSSGQMSRLCNILPSWKAHDDPISESLEKIWRNRVDKLMLNDHWERQLRRFRGEFNSNISDRTAVVSFHPRVDALRFESFAGERHPSSRSRKVPQDSPRVSDRRHTQESVPSIGTPLSRIFPIAAWKVNSTEKPIKENDEPKDGEVVQIKLKEQLITHLEVSSTPVPSKPTEVQFHPVVEARFFTPSKNQSKRRKTLPAEENASSKIDSGQ